MAAKSSIAPNALKEFSIKLKGDVWRVTLHTEKNFHNAWGYCLGVCDYDHRKGHREISFAGPRVSKNTIAHELMHAYLSYRNFTRSKPLRIEETVCDVVGAHHQTLKNLTDKIFKALKK